MGAVHIIIASLLITPFKPDQEINCNDHNTCACDATLNPEDTCILKCDKGESCQGKQLQCYNNSLCSIFCESKDACNGATLVSNGATDVSISCTSNTASSDTCLNATFECGAGSCALECAGGASQSVCDGAHVTTIQETTDFQCVTVCPTTLQAVEFTSAPTSPPSPPSSTPTRDPTSISTNPTRNPTQSPHIESREVKDDPSTSSASAQDNASVDDFEFAFGSVNSYILISGVSAVCCCFVLGFGFCFYRQQKKKREMVEAFSHTFGTKKGGSKSPTAEDTSPADTAPNTAQVEEHRKGTFNTVSLEKADQGTFNTVNTASFNTEPFSNSYFTKPKEFDRQSTVQFEKEIQNTTAVESVLMDDIVTDMSTPKHPESTLAETQDGDVFAMGNAVNDTGMLVDEDEDEEEDDDDDNDVIQEMQTPQQDVLMEEDELCGDDDDNDVVIGMSGPTPH